MRCSPEQKQQAIELAADIGPAEAARRLGLNANTVRSWLSRAGVIAHATTVATKAPEVALKVVTIAERKARIAEKLAAAAERMTDELFAATVERKAMAAGQMREVEIVDIRRKTTTPTERKVMLQAIAQAVETVQLLTGEATERIEQLGGGSTVEAAKALLADVRERHLKVVR